MPEHVVRNAHLPLLQIYKDDVCLQEVPLQNNVVSMGRGTSNQVRLGDITVSRNHARLLWREEGRCYFLEELQTTNGVFLNGRRLQGTAMVVDGDRIRIGIYDIVFVDRAAVERWCTTLQDAVRINKAMNRRSTAPQMPVATRRAFLLREDNGQVHLLEKDRVAIGESVHADIQAHGAGIAAEQAVIARRGRRYYLLNNSELCSVTVNGRSVSNAQLAFNDRIEIGNSRFIFREI